MKTKSKKLPPPNEQIDKAALKIVPEVSEFVTNDIKKALVKADKTTTEIFAENRAQGDDIHVLDYNVCVVFQSGRQKREFIEKLKGLEVIDETFIDGMELAEVLGIKLKTPVLQTIPKAKLKDRIRVLVDWTLLERR